MMKDLSENLNKNNIEIELEGELNTIDNIDNKITI